MSKRRVLELSVDRVEMDLTAGRSGSHMLIVTLVWPRPAIAERSSVMVLDLDKGVQDFAEGPWHRKILFKEPVEGPFAVEVAVTEKMGSAAIADFVSHAAGSMMKSVGAEAADLVSGATAGGFARIPFQFLSRFISSAGKKNPSLIGSGAVDMPRKSSSKKSSMTTSVEVTLTVPETIYKTVRRKAHGSAIPKRKIVARKGVGSGRVVLSSKVY